ncbi:MAG TPA: 50S ribosomal protein L2 [Planctomycetota bacterium]|nr:50S ribosomal protein L2 [Planctomycetota bacterium]
MGLKQYRPMTPGSRQRLAFDFSEITKDRPERRLTEAVRKSGGRDNYGHETNINNGGGHRRRYRIIDFRRQKDGIPARVAAIEYDPNRSARIALLHYADGEKRYILCPDTLEVGAKIMSGPTAEPETGNCLPLKNIPLGTIIHNIEIKQGRGGQIARSAGIIARLLAKEGPHAHIEMPSGEVRQVSIECRATVGQVGNLDHQNEVLGKAGRSAWRGIRPHVRGVAKNPVDHPMGGGASRRHGGRPPCSRTGLLSKGGRTRKRKKYSNVDILRKRKKLVEA